MHFYMPSKNLFFLPFFLLLKTLCLEALKYLVFGEKNFLMDVNFISNNLMKYKINKLATPKNLI